MIIELTVVLITAKLTHYLSSNVRISAFSQFYFYLFIYFYFGLLIKETFKDGGSGRL